MTENMKKRIERRFLETAELAYGGFPKGIITECERPDFIVTTSKTRIGIEVTRLVQSRPSAVESFRNEVVELAQEFYQKTSTIPLDVTVCFSSRPVGKQDKRHLAHGLAEFARTNNSAKGASISHFPEDDPAVCFPTGVVGITLAVPLRGIGHWLAVAVGQTPVFDRACVATTIAEKHALAAHYKDRVDEVWLLLVAEDHPYRLWIHLTLMGPYLLVWSHRPLKPNPARVVFT